MRKHHVFFAVVALVGVVLLVVFQMLDDGGLGPRDDGQRQEAILGDAPAPVAE